MGKCKFCGKSAGYFSDSHKECEIIHSNGLKIATSTIKEALISKLDPSVLKVKLRELSFHYFLTQEDINRVVSETWCEVATKIYPIESEVSYSDIEYLLNFSKEFSIEEGLVLEVSGRLQTIADINNNTIFLEYYKTWGVFEKVIPFVLGHDELIVWIFGKTVYRVPSEKTLYSKSYYGTSFRVTAGMRYYFGSSQGYPVAIDNSEMDLGNLVLTTRRVLFYSRTLYFESTYDDIFLFHISDLNDSVIVKCKGSGNKLTEHHFLVGKDDSWFLYSMLHVLKQKQTREI